MQIRVHAILVDGGAEDAPVLPCVGNRHVGAWHTFGLFVQSYCKTGRATPAFDTTQHDFLMQADLFQGSVILSLELVPREPLPVASVGNYSDGSNDKSKRRVKKAIDKTHIRQGQALRMTTG